MENCTPNRTMVLAKLEPISEKNENGLYNVKDDIPPVRMAKVISVGGDYVLPNGDVLPLCCKESDIVAIRNTVAEISIVDKKNDIICVNDKDILFVKG